MFFLVKAGRELQKRLGQICRCLLGAAGTGRRRRRTELGRKETFRCQVSTAFLQTPPGYGAFELNAIGKYYTAPVSGDEVVLV